MKRDEEKEYATKSDIHSLEQLTKTEFTIVRTEMKESLSAFALEIRTEMKENFAALLNLFQKCSSI